MTTMANSDRRTDTWTTVEILDVFEDLLTRRSDLGFQPVLYVSAERDLECTLISLFEREFAAEASDDLLPRPTTQSVRWRRVR